MYSEAESAGYSTAQRIIGAKLSSENVPNVETIFGTIQHLTKKVIEMNEQLSCQAETLFGEVSNSALSTTLGSDKSPVVRDSTIERLDDLARALNSLSNTISRF